MSISTGQLHQVYQGATPWVGVTVSDTGRTFVLYPRPMGEAGTRVAELIDGQPVPYPSLAWNDWQPGRPVAETFVRVNALRIGPDGLLWVVDTGTAKAGAPILLDAPKLVAINLITNAVTRIIPLNGVLKSNSFVDDVRFFDSTIYVTDAGKAALLVLDKETGHGRRVLEHDPSTTAQRPLRAEGTALTSPNGQPVRVQVDQLEVSPDGRYLYYQPACGSMSRIETRWLRDASIPASELSQRVEFFCATPSTGGTAMDAEGIIYLSDVDHLRLLRITPDGQMTVLLEDERLRWADALWLDSRGSLWIPVAQLNRLPIYHGGVSLFQPPVYIYQLPLGVKPLRT